MPNSDPIVLVHGFIGSLGDARILRSFGDNTVHAPDLLGYGTLQDVKRQWSLEDQADHLANIIAQQALGRVHIVGHSVGGAIGVVFADRHPDKTRSLTSVEGNFTLKDAFWTGQIARMSPSEVESVLAEYRADAGAWLKKSIPRPDDWALSVAPRLLENQGALTLLTQARAVIAETSQPRYLDRIQRLVSKGLLVSLIAGERSRSAWDVPEWMMAQLSIAEIAKTGHLMMFENPAGFAEAVLKGLRPS
jgi:pimeloyl-ACP methyl ester carboxylesterase